MSQYWPSADDNRVTASIRSARHEQTDERARRRGRGQSTHSDQYLQLFVSAPGGAVFCQRAAIAGMKRLLYVSREMALG